MRQFVRNLFRSFKKPVKPQKRSFSTSPTMSGSATAAILYATTISTSSITGAVPEEAKEKRHHLKDGKGFTNPWDSWRDFSAPGIIKAMIWHGQFPGMRSWTNFFKAQSLWWCESSRHVTSYRSGPEAILRPVQGYANASCHMAWPCMLLRRVPRGSSSALRSCLQRAMQPV